MFGSGLVATYEGGFRVPERPQMLVYAISEHVPPAPEIPPLPAPPTPLPRLTLRLLGGYDEITVAPFDVHGQPSSPAFSEIRQFLGTRGGADVPIHPDLVALLMRVSRAFDRAPITIVSGHREPGRGTRRTSYHVRGMAADIAVENVSSRELHKVVKEEALARGVGLYPHFVHVDVRPDREPYRWVGGGWRRRRY